MRTLASFHDLASLLAGDHEVMVLRRVERRRVREPLTTEDLLGNTVESLRLVFDTCALYVVCVGESDEIAISAEPDAWVAPHVADLSALAPWNDVIGHELYKVWRVLSDSGYDDGLQLRFGPSDGTRVIQLEGVASMIKTHAVVPVVG